MQNLKNHGRHENLECGTDVHYPDPIIKEYDPLGHITGYACLLCKIAEKGLSQKKPSAPGMALSFVKVVKKLNHRNN